MDRDSLTLVWNEKTVENFENLFSQRTFFTTGDKILIFKFSFLCPSAFIQCVMECLTQGQDLSKISARQISFRMLSMKLNRSFIWLLFFFVQNNLDLIYHNGFNRFLLDSWSLSMLGNLTISDFYKVRNLFLGTFC